MRGESSRDPILQHHLGFHVFQRYATPDELMLLLLLGLLVGHAGFRGRIRRRFSGGKFLVIPFRSVLRSSDRVSLQLVSVARSIANFRLFGRLVMVVSGRGRGRGRSRGRGRCIVETIVAQLWWRRWQRIVAIVNLVFGYRWG